LSIGAPELSKNINYTAQMGNFYKLPTRSGGGLTDALYPDAQAGVESAIAIYTAARNGINFILHAAGILGSYIAMSFEKFLIDEEACGMVRKMLQPIAITDETIDIETICKVGPGGQYLTNPKTFKLCRTEFFIPDLMVRSNYDAWSASGKKKVHEVADVKLTQRLAKYEKPDIDSGIEKDLTEYVNRRKQA
jgi:trimethylamine--corrinoid protein Co-methyltransferase